MPPRKPRPKRSRGSPRRDAPLYTLARLQQRKGEQIEALKSFQACLAFNPLVGLNGIYQSMGPSPPRAELRRGDRRLQQTRAPPERRRRAPGSGDTCATQPAGQLAEFAVALTVGITGRLPTPASPNSICARAVRRCRERREPRDGPRCLTQPETHYALGTALMRLGRRTKAKGLKEFERLQQKAAADRARSRARPHQAQAQLAQ
jgi:hypothetical protein